jgi:uncharacterized membrane protein
LNKTVRLHHPVYKQNQGLDGDLGLPSFFICKGEKNMPKKNLSTTQKLTLSALVMALYVAVMFFTQSFAFGQYQIRIATSIYALAALYPFLIVPLALANLLSNLVMGGLGPLDMIGGFCVGLLTTSLIVLVKKYDLPNMLIVLIITLVPGLGVPIWLSYLLHIPYKILAFSLVVGQFIPGIIGSVLVTALEKRAYGVTDWKESKSDAQ